MGYSFPLSMPPAGTFDEGADQICAALSKTSAAH